MGRCVLVVVNDGIRCRQNGFNRCAGRKGRRPIGKFVILAVDDNHDRKAVLLAENEVALVTWGEESEVVGAGNGNTFSGALVLNVAVNLLPASKGVRDSFHACAVEGILERVEPDEPRFFEVHLETKLAALGTHAVLLVAVVVCQVAGAFTGGWWKVVVCSHGRNLEAFRQIVQMISSTK